jgi:K+-sensing histidine kinase KdpD
VRDEGPGIAPAALERLFDKFYRADEGDRRRAGTGLGLAIAKGFVEVQEAPSPRAIEAIAAARIRDELSAMTALTAPS